MGVKIIVKLFEVSCVRSKIIITVSLTSSLSRWLIHLSSVNLLFDHGGSISHKN